MTHQGNQKIILNVLPPADIRTPSISLSALKGFMMHHRCDTEIKYWNTLMVPAVSEYPFSDEARMIIRDAETLQYLFYAMLAEAFHDDEAMERIIALFHSQMPMFKFYNQEFYRWFIRDNIEKLHNIIEVELEKMNLDQALLFGLTSKFFQWIPGTLLAREVKKKNPHLPVIIGGFGNKESAHAAMVTCPGFDFAVWGEGEYPLLELVHRLQSGTQDYNGVPRLIYRSEGSLTVSNSASGGYIDLDRPPYPDYNDYFSAVEGKVQPEDVTIPIEGIRGCSWNRCHFCVLNAGYKYREKSPENIVKEMEYYADTFGVHRFFFTDNNVTGLKLERFTQLLDLLIRASEKRERKFNLVGDLIPAGFNEFLMEKLVKAGFVDVQFGYEALTDSLLKKMNKSSCFSDNIFLLKFAQKYGIVIRDANLIRGIPGETEADLVESKENLHFLRFFLGENRFAHEFWQLAVYKGAKYYDMLTPAEREQCTQNFTAYYLPRAFIKDESRFTLFYYTRPLTHPLLWEQVETIEKYYRENNSTYTINRDGDALLFEEFHNGEPVGRHHFTDPRRVDVLKETNRRVCSLSHLLTVLSEKYPGITETEVIDILTGLKAAYLVYCNRDYNNIISVIDVNM